LKQQKQMMEQRQAQQGQQPNGNLEARMSVMEQKLDRLCKHLGVKTDDIKSKPVTPTKKPEIKVKPTKGSPAPPANSKPPKKKKNKK
jgi:hypothetical protein